MNLANQGKITKGLFIIFLAIFLWTVAIFGEVLLTSMFPGSRYLDTVSLDLFVLSVILGLLITIVSLGSFSIPGSRIKYLKVLILFEIILLICVNISPYIFGPIQREQSKQALKLERMQLADEAELALAHCKPSKRFLNITENFLPIVNESNDANGKYNQFRYLYKCEENFVFPEALRNSIGLDHGPVTPLEIIVEYRGNVRSAEEKTSEQIDQMNWDNSHCKLLNRRKGRITDDLYSCEDGTQLAITKNGYTSTEEGRGLLLDDPVWCRNFLLKNPELSGIYSIDCLRE